MKVLTVGPILVLTVRAAVTEKPPVRALQLNSKKMLMYKGLCYQYKDESWPVLITVLTLLQKKGK